MLSTWTRIFGEAHLDVFFVDFVSSSFCGITHNDRDGRSVYAAFAFVGRHTLPTVTATFLVELIECVFVFRPNFGEESARLGAQNSLRPALGQSVFFIELRLNANERFGVVSAFGSANLDMA